MLLLIVSQISNHFSHRSFTKNLQGWYEGLIAHTPPGDKYFLRLVLPIISLGVHYSSFTGSLTQGTHSLQQLSKKILTQTEYRFCERGSSIMCADGKFNLFNGRFTAGPGILEVVSRSLTSLDCTARLCGRDFPMLEERRSWWGTGSFNKCLFNL